MSEFLSVAGSISSLLGRDIFRLGDVVFLETEVPDNLFWGGYQAASVLYMPDGNKVVSSGGYFEYPISWKGIFRGVSALRKARTLENMARSGQTYIFSGASKTKSVIIKEFSIDYMYCGSVIPYYIVCEILPDILSTASNFSYLKNIVGSDIADTVSSVAGAVNMAASWSSQATSQLSNYLGQVTPFATLFGDGSALSRANSILSGYSTSSGVIANLSSSASLDNLSSSLSSAGSFLESAFSIFDGELNSLSVNGGDDLMADSNSLVAATAYSGLQADTVVAQSYLRRSINNISNIV